MPIQNNLSIKKQFYDKYLDGIVGIDSEMSFQFIETSFTNPNRIEMSYSVGLVKNG